MSYYSLNEIMRTTSYPSTQFVIPQSYQVTLSPQLQTDREAIISAYNSLMTAYTAYQNEVKNSGLESINDAFYQKRINDLKNNVKGLQDKITATELQLKNEKNSLQGILDSINKSETALKTISQLKLKSQELNNQIQDYNKKSAEFNNKVKQYYNSL